MPFTINFYHDQICAEGAMTSALPRSHRLLYVRHGRVMINDRLLNADEAAYCDEPLALRSAGEWSQIWRWELAAPNAAPVLHRGAGVLSSLRMSRVITSLVMSEGSRWLLRLDRIVTAAGRVADRHQHPGPGIRCLLEGTFNVQQAIESARDLLAADAGKIPARNGAPGGVGRTSDRDMAFRTPAAIRQLEAIRRPYHRAVRHGDNGTKTQASG